MSTDSEWDTPSLPKCVADLTKKVDQRQHGPDDEAIDESLLDDEFNEGEPASKRPCLCFPNSIVRGDQRKYR